MDQSSSQKQADPYSSWHMEESPGQGQEELALSPAPGAIPTASFRVLMGALSHSIANPVSNLAGQPSEGSQATGLGAAQRVPAPLIPATSPWPSYPISLWEILIPQGSEGTRPP